MNQTHPKIIATIVVSISALAAICVMTICFCNAYKVEPSERVFQALLLITGNLTGALTAILTNTRSQTQGEPVKTEVTNTAANPVKVEETK